jgi:hypothetical protein
MAGVRSAKAWLEIRGSDGKGGLNRSRAILRLFLMAGCADYFIRIPSPDKPATDRAGRD